MSHVALRPAVRYWFYQPYTGHFLSGNLSAALYDVGTEKSYRRGWMAGAGFSYGYAWPLSTICRSGGGAAASLPPKTSGYTAPAGSLSAPRNAR